MAEGIQACKDQGNAGKTEQAANKGPKFGETGIVVGQSDRWLLLFSH